MQKKSENLRYSIAKSVEFRDRLMNHLYSTIELPSDLYGHTLVSGTNPPAKNSDYYQRMGSLLIKLIENPCGVKHLRTIYGKMKRNRCKPPTRAKSTLYPLKIMLDLLDKNGYLWRNTKGYFTSTKGKQLIKSLL